MKQKKDLTRKANWKKVGKFGTTLFLLGTLAFVGCKSTDSEDGTSGTNGTSGTDGTSASDQITAISLIQGAGHYSPYEGQELTVQGIVTSPNKNGSFYIQSDASSDDGDSYTSEGIYIYQGKDATGDNSSVAEGDLVKVKGVIHEHFAKTRTSFMGLSLTEIKSGVVTQISTGNTLPTPIVLGSGGLVMPTSIIDNDTNGRVRNDSYDPAEDGIDLFESVEGMLVQVNNAVVVGSNDFGSLPVLADNGAGVTGRNARGGITISEGDFNPERIILDDYYQGSEPSVNVGAVFNTAVVGVMSYVSGTYDNHYKLLAKAWPATADITASTITQETTNLEPTGDYLTVATYNVENLTGLDSSTDYDKHAAVIVNKLKSPDLIGLEEIADNDDVTTDITTSASTTLGRLITSISNAGGPTYSYAQIDPVEGADGGKPGINIRVGFFYNASRISLTTRGGTGDATTDNPVVNNSGTPQLTYSPGRIIDPHVSYDPTQDVFTDGRKSLAAEFTFNGHQIFAIVNHFKSKSGDEPLYGQNQPPTLHSEAIRTPQAALVQSRIKAITDISSDAKIIVLGDMNDFPYSTPVKTLMGDAQNIYNLMDKLPVEERYTYVYKGNSQVLDHILVSKSLLNSDSTVDAVHVNAEFIYNDSLRSSDHDPVVSRFLLPSL